MAAARKDGEDASEWPAVYIHKLERGGRSPGGAFVNKPGESPRLVRSQGTVTVTVTVPVVLSSVMPHPERLGRGFPLVSSLLQ